jgi:hypothetical protein
MYRLSLESRFTCCGLHKLGSFRKVKVDDLPAFITDGMIVAISFAVVAAGAIAEANFVNQARFF